MEKPLLTDKRIGEIADAALARHKGDSRKLASAIGMLHIGRRLGYRPLLLMMDKTTIRLYEQILKVEFREIFPDVGEQAEKSMAWRAAKGLSNFWKAVKGEIAGIRSTDLK